MVTLNSNGTCSACHGRVRNAEGRRYTVARLTEIHAETCPGVRRVAKAAQ